MEKGYTFQLKARLSDLQSSSQLDFTLRKKIPVFHTLLMAIFVSY